MAPRVFPGLVGAGDGDSWLVQEFVDSVSGYSIDMFVPAHVLAIEVDGPSHFDWKGQRPLGATLMKRRHLRRLGLRVLSVSYLEWEEAGGRGATANEGRCELLSRKITQELRE